MSSDDHAKRIGLFQQFHFSPLPVELLDRLEVLGRDGLAPYFRYVLYGPPVSARIGQYRQGDQGYPVAVMDSVVSASSSLSLNSIPSDQSILLASSGKKKRMNSGK